MRICLKISGLQARTEVPRGLRLSVEGSARQTLTFRACSTVAPVIGALNSVSHLTKAGITLSIML